MATLILILSFRPMLLHELMVCAACMQQAILSTRATADVSPLSIALAFVVRGLI